MRKRPWEAPLKLFQRTELSRDWGDLCYQGKDDRVSQSPPAGETHLPTKGCRCLLSDWPSLESSPLQSVWQPPSLKGAAVTEAEKVVGTLFVQKSSETSQLGPSTAIS